MTHCMDTSQIHFSATPVIEFMSKMSLVPEMEVPGECHYGTLPQGDQLPGDRLITLDYFHHGRISGLFSLQ